MSAKKTDKKKVTFGAVVCYPAKLPVRGTMKLRAERLRNGLMAAGARCSRFLTGGRCTGAESFDDDDKTAIVAAAMDDDDDVVDGPEEGEAAPSGHRVLPATRLPFLWLCSSANRERRAASHDQNSPVLEEPSEEFTDTSQTSIRKRLENLIRKKESKEDTYKIPSELQKQLKEMYVY